MTAAERELPVAVGTAVFALIAAAQTEYRAAPPFEAAREAAAVKMGMAQARENLVAALGSVKREAQ